MTTQVEEFFKSERMVAGWCYDWYTSEPDCTLPTMRHRMVLNSGVSMSVQANETAYCYPRENLRLFESYREYEVGFPSEKIEELMMYAEQPEIPTETVYGYVPAEVIEDIIAKNGGIDWEATILLIEKKKQRQLENKK